MTLRLTDDETEALRRRAQLESRSMQDVARQAVREYVENHSRTELLDQVLDVFGITPETDLNLMRPGQSLAGLSARALEALDAFYAETQPDLVLVQGDTTTVFIATKSDFV